MCLFPVLQVLCQEMLRYNRLLAIIRDSLVALGKALSGLQVLSSELDTVLRWAPCVEGRAQQQGCTQGIRSQGGKSMLRLRFL